MKPYVSLQKRMKLTWKLILRLAVRDGCQNGDHLFSWLRTLVSENPGFTLSSMVRVRVSHETMDKLISLSFKFLIFKIRVMIESASEDC